MQFEWDETKRQANITKHDVDFLEAMELLADAPIMHDDSRKDYGERRCQAVGIVDGKTLVVIFTIRESSFRIISARRANSRERRKYAKDL
ncbi:BrnT family toxin [Solidesulfovibrio alcoholivorans]|uniref:BrnT family toxin n=1 Tax=Solidesulfovibrio alcoholivorans TaxID=81406 RepID=UPI000496C185|nr:BrnT family toxin [Solidesulfovibrio alcoholivorans]